MSTDQMDDYLSALEHGQWGAFPFGRPNARRLPTVSAETSAAVVVLGVYPSAFHVVWTPPAGGTPIQALAVDVEPTVFSAGDDATTKARRIADWKVAINDDGSFGTFGWAAANGSSGLGVEQNYLNALGVSYAQCFLTDCVPFYVVKSGKAGQGAAIDARWRPFAQQRGWAGGDLPQRPTTKSLVEMAARPERGLAAEIASAQPTTVVTLRQEAADAFERVVDNVLIPPPGLPLSATADTYGVPGRVVLHGREVKWIPLAHPGITRRAGNPWHVRHREWATTASALLEIQSR
jgi:hypothetical protein